MSKTKSEKDFKMEEYDEFYTEHMDFVSIPENLFLTVHEFIPRFGWAFDQVGELKPKNLLDLGCLDGSFALSIANHYKIPTTGVDMNKRSTAIGNERAKKYGVTTTCIQSAAEDFLEACEPHSFDVITFFEIIEHVKDVPRLLKLIDRALAPGGSVLVSTPAFESPNFGKDDEVNKCHIRLYTLEPEDYEEVNKYGTLRKATSLYKEIGPDRIQEAGVYSELINARYQ